MVVDVLIDFVISLLIQRDLLKSGFYMFTFKFLFGIFASSADTSTLIKSWYLLIKVCDWTWFLGNGIVMFSSTFVVLFSDIVITASQPKPMQLCTRKCTSFLWCFGVCILLIVEKKKYNVKSSWMCYYFCLLCFQDTVEKPVKKIVLKHWSG